MSAIKKAVTHLGIGGQTKLAKALGVKQSHVWNWVNHHEQAPAKYIRAIAKITKNKISVNQLLQDHETKNDKNQAELKKAS